MSHLATRDLAYAGLLTALIAVGAWLSIPLGPVPFTLQVVFVLLAGMLLGPRLGFMSVGAYLCLGLVAPVFAGATSGVGVLVGPTAGYLWGFLAAAVLTGWLSQGRPSTVRFALAGVAGLLPIYLAGAMWLAVQLHLGPWEAVSAGVLQFLPFDGVKALLAALLARTLVTLPLGLVEHQGQ